MVTVNLRNKTAAIIIALTLVIPILGWFTYNLVKQYKIDQAKVKALKIGVQKTQDLYDTAKRKLDIARRERKVRKIIRKVCGSVLYRKSTFCDVNRITLNHGLKSLPARIIRCREDNDKHICQFMAPYRYLDCEYVTKRVTCRYGMYQCQMWKSGFITKRYLDCGLIPK